MLLKSVLVVVTLAPATLAAATSCESVVSLALPNTSITKAELIAPGAFPRTGEPYQHLPAFCRVAATLKPSSDSDIHIEVWMPASGWNGRLQSVGRSAGEALDALTAQLPAEDKGTLVVVTRRRWGEGRSGVKGSFTIDFLNRERHVRVPALRACRLT